MILIHSQKSCVLLSCVNLGLHATWLRENRVNKTRRSVLLSLHFLRISKLAFLEEEEPARGKASDIKVRDSLSSSENNKKSTISQLKE